MMETSLTTEQLTFEDWGLIDYQTALDKQLALVEDVVQSGRLGTLVFCSHPHVVTLGRKTQEGDVFAWDGPILEVSRGGRATYHGPSQLVVYPIMNLDKARPHRGPRDIGKFLRALEDGIVKVLALYGVSAVGKTLQAKSATAEASEETGVWVGQQKIASLGIAVKKWVTYHGAAINLEEDAKSFAGMRPCGFSHDIMVNLQKILGNNVNRQEFQNHLKNVLLETL